MLERLTIDSFKAFGESHEIPLSPMTLIVGANGSGKTSILQAIELMGALVRGTLGEALAERRWDYADLVHLRAQTKTMRFVAELELDDRSLEWNLELGKRRRMGVASELVDAGGAVELERAGRQMRRLDATTGEYESIKQTLTSSWLAAVATGSDAALSATEVAEDTDRFPDLQRVAAWARGIRPYVVLDPLVLREPHRTHDAGLGEHGEGLAAFLREIGPDRRAAVVARVREHYPQLRDVRAQRGGDGLTRLTIREDWGEELALGARQVSDGLLRLLALAAMHELPETPSVLLIDEIENGVHPGLLGGIVSMLGGLAAAGVQVVATTHSPVALSFVDSAEQVLVVGRRADGLPRVARLSDSVRFQDIAEGFAPGEAWYALGEEKLLESVPA